jgi:hypothetical protein
MAQVEAVTELTPFGILMGMSKSPHLHLHYLLMIIAQQAHTIYL